HRFRLCSDGSGWLVDGRRAHGGFTGERILVLGHGLDDLDGGRLVWAGRGGGGRSAVRGTFAAREAGAARGAERACFAGGLRGRARGGLSSGRSRGDRCARSRRRRRGGQAVGRLFGRTGLFWI